MRNSPSSSAPQPAPDSPLLPFPPPERLMILGMRADNVDTRSALLYIEALVERHRQQGGPAFQVSTANTEFVWETRHNTVFRETVNNSALVVADGMGIVWASRILK